MTATETADVEQVDKAILAIQAGDTITAQNFLLDVMKRAPTQYTYQFVDS